MVRVKDDKEIGQASEEAKEELTLPAAKERFDSDTIISFSDAFSSAFVQWWSRHQAKSRFFWMGSQAGAGMDFTPAPASELAAGDQFFHRLFGQATLDNLRLLGKEIITILHDAGVRMHAHGVMPTTNNSESIRHGIELRNGERIILPAELADSLARDQRLAFHALRDFSRTLENRHLHYKDPADTGSVIEIGDSRDLDFATDRGRTEVYGLAFALAGASTGQFRTILQVCPEKSGLVTSHFRAFSARGSSYAAFLNEWATKQWSSGWVMRKRLEPGGTSHPSFVYQEQFGELTPADLLFTKRMSAGQLDFLRAKGKECVQLLSSLGEKLLSQEWDMSHGEMVEPLKGLPLKNGERVIIPSELLHHIAYENHTLWLRTREWSWTIPDRTLWQPKTRKDNAHQEWDKHSPNKLWRWDMIGAYGLCCALAVLRRETPRYYQSLLDACV